MRAHGGLCCSNMQTNNRIMNIKSRKLGSNVHISCRIMILEIYKNKCRDIQFITVACDMKHSMKRSDWLESTEVHVQYQWVGGLPPDLLHDVTREPAWLTA